MFYSNLKFSKPKNRAFFYTNFVSTLDGKAAVKDDLSYWPLGSKFDFEVLLELRAYADILIHGSNTARASHALRRIKENQFNNLRKKLNKSKVLRYVIVSNNPDDSLIPYVENPPFENVILAVSNSSKVPKKIAQLCEVVSLGEKTVDMKKLSSYLFNNNYNVGLVEGGPTVLGSFLKENLLDEVFLTITPKIIGNISNQTYTMVEGHLFKPEAVQKYKLLSVKQIGDELFLRYHKLVIHNSLFILHS